MKILEYWPRKNFLAGSLVDQHYYFDEMEGSVQFPAMFPVALLSCALLDKAKQVNYAFETNPSPDFRGPENAANAEKQ